MEWREVGEGKGNGVGEGEKQWWISVRWGKGQVGEEGVGVKKVEHD